MTKIIYTLCIFATLSFTACGQSKAKQDTEETKQSSTKNNKMDTSKLTNETIKKAFVHGKMAIAKHFYPILLMMPNCLTMAIQEIFQNL